jgi:hypothetical protein
MFYVACELIPDLNLKVRLHSIEHGKIWNFQTHAWEVNPSFDDSAIPMTNTVAGQYEAEMTDVNEAEWDGYVHAYIHDISDSGDHENEPLFSPTYYLLDGVVTPPPDPSEGST